MEYVGTAYAGFQKQPGKVTVQSTLENALSQVTQEPVQILGSGRTDAGTHAVHQVVAFSTRTELDPATLYRAVNAHLPCDIAVTTCADVPSDFNPRTDAASRVYRYVIWNRPVRSPFMLGRAAHVKRPLDERLMDEAARRLVGRFDLGAFLPMQSAGKRERTIYAASCTREGHLVFLDLEATGFMKQMARAIAGTLVRVGLGKMTPSEFGEVLISRDRTRAGDTAPACGLYLVCVRYRNFDFDDQDKHSSGAWLTGAAGS